MSLHALSKRVTEFNERDFPREGLSHRCSPRPYSDPVSYLHARVYLLLVASDPSVLSRRQDALMSARERFQHLVDQNSSLAEQRAKELADEKQKAKLEEWERHRAFGGGINDKSSRDPKVVCADAELIIPILMCSCSVHV